MNDILGLDKNKTKEIADKLNVLLSNYSVFYQNTRGSHWNIKGGEFFELHEKFEELYDDLAEKIDAIAERIATLGHIPSHSFSGYLKITTIKESGIIEDGEEAVREILNSFKVIFKLQRELLDLSDDAKDEATNALMSDFISAQEIQVWMYNAFLS